MTSSLDEGPATNPLTARKTSVVVEPVQADRPSSNPLSRGTVGSTVPDDDDDAHHRATPGNPLGQPSPTPRCNDRSYSEADSAEVPLFTPMERLRRLLFIFFVEWKLFYAALLAICLIISVLLLCECTYEYITAKNANDRVTLSLETARATYDTAAMCMQTQSVAPVPVPESLSSLMSDIKKHHKDKKSEYIPHLEEAIAYLEEGKCQLAVISVNNLFSIISGSVDTQKSMLFISDFIYAFSSGWTQLESQGLLQMTESTPVTSSRALTGSSTNLLCSKLILNYLMQNPSMEPLHGVLTCSSEITNTVVNYTPVVIPQGQSINSMSLFTSFLSYDWMGTTTSNFNVGLYLPHFILNGATIIICLVGLFVVLYVTQLQLRFDKKQLVVDRDFLVAHERKGVQLQPDTLRLLDYYCWKVGSLESPDLDELSQLLVDPDSIAHLVIQKYNAQVAQEAAQTTSDPFARALTSHSNKEDDVGSMASSAGGEQRIASRTQSKNDEITDVHPLLLQVSQRQKTLQHYARELAELRDATQLQLYMHHTAHPIALLRPFVPDHMMGVASFQLPDIAGLGPSVTAKHASSVLQEGLVAGQPAALLFVSFRPFNRPGAVGTAAQLYMRRADEAAAEALALARQQGGCCGGKAEQSVVPKGGAQREVLHDDSTDVVVMADDRSSVSMERLDITAYNNLCGRLVDDARLQSALCAGTGPNPLHTKGSREAAHVVVEDAANAFEPTDYPLSPLAAGINFLLESVWRWSSTFCGEVVQMSSDGVLIKFPTDGCGKLDRNGVAARSSILGTDLDEVMDVGPQHGKTVEVTVHGKTYQLCAEERAARTALSIHTALERFLDYSENHLVPPELLRCPMVVLYDEGCVAGRLRFHVSKHYSLLSRQIPLMFPLEQVWEEYGATVIITQAVQSRLEGMCLSRPIHYVDVEDLNCYYVPRSGAETERLQRRSAAAAANASPPIEGEAAPDAGPVSPVAYESDDVDDVSEFRASGTIFDLQGIRDLDATSQAYGIFMDEEARTRARRDHWRLIWSRYEEMMSHKEHKDLRLAYTRLMLMEARSMDVNIESVSTQQQQQQQQVGDVSKSSYGASGGDSFSTGIGGKPTPPADIIDITLTPVLQDCYRELQSYRHIYGVPGGEAYSFKKVLDDVVVMLTALGEECTALDMTDNGV